MTTQNAIGNKSGTITINNYTMPASDGSTNQIIKTNGSGVLSFTDQFPSGTVLQTISTFVDTVQTITDVVPFDNTIPQISEGAQILSLSITPHANSNKIYVTWYVAGSASSGSDVSIAVSFYQDSNVNALFTAASHANANAVGECSGKFTFSAGTTSSSSISMRVGVDSGTFYVNGDGSGTRLFGGALQATLTIQEIQA